MAAIYTTIKDITPTTESWKIEMRVLEKSGKRTSKSSPLKYQKLMLADKKGNDVEAVIFGTEIDARENTLEVFHTYYISNAYVKKTAPPFDKKQDYKYSWIVNSRTEIEEIQTEDNQVSTPNYDFIPFSNLHIPKEFSKPIGLSLSSCGTSTFKINPQLPEAEALKEW
ncbi:uncharacterized protein LOC133036570 [Cannabis sativa]|uniref:uncharacterized protein LOC133036570 n=1 Tax=Cannabis sativa TaxID=3483 RepID=UPI0029C9D5E4|nr:uncharacterized protein LOC133036570 [Cannabis sativa]